ncbi:hypothetical protein [Streptomyces sp. AS58]|uniref:hypothetical protein n=1 Tax=Streptomyces sp. AS58 TaxID=1519489 RepID=UPI000B308EB2|nr:hypothetical protein [Streptomyces sp. AS58]
MAGQIASPCTPTRIGKLHGRVYGREAETESRGVGDHADYARSLATFKESTGPMKSRDVVQALDHELLSNDITEAHARLKRLVKLDIDRRAARPDGPVRH